jgi:hypothetical protein
MVMTGRPPKPMIERFWPKVNKTESCWLWLGAKDLDGYGFIKRRDGAQIRAHRFIYENENNCSLLRGTQIMHKCDNPSCVNPHHLMMGTNQDNMDDMIRKGRKGLAKLTPEQVIQIYRSAESNKNLSKKYNVGINNIMAIKRRAKWKSLTSGI